MGDIDIAAARALCDAATPGPWSAMTTGVRGGDHWHVCTDDESIAHIAADDGSNEDQRQPDAEFIAAARTLVPALLDAVERVKAIHVPAAIYGTCDCDNSLWEHDYPPPGHVEVEDIGWTCNKLHDVCGECCMTDGTWNTEECADVHDHGPGEPICATAGALQVIAASNRRSACGRMTVRGPCQLDAGHSASHAADFMDDTPLRGPDA